MAEEKIVCCKYCGKEMPISMAWKEKPTSRTYFCSENCFTLSKAKTIAKPNERKEFTDWLIENVYKKEGFCTSKINWKMLMSQYKNLTDNNPTWTYETVKYIIWYMTEVLDLTLLTEEGHWSPFSLVEFYAKEAEDFWNDCDKVNQNIENFDFNNDNIRTIKQYTHKKKPKQLSFD